MDDKPALNELSALLAAELDSIGSALNSVSRAIICGIFDDAIARAEAAKVELEAEVRDLRDRVGEATEAAAEWQDAYAMNEVYGPTQLEMLRARVAKLEAALAAERAAHQWRPVSQKPMHTLRYQVVLQHGQRFPAVDHVVYDAMSGWASPDAIYWRPTPPLPPAPDAQEPTP